MIQLDPSIFIVKLAYSYNIILSRLTVVSREAKEEVPRDERM